MGEVGDPGGSDLHPLDPSGSFLIRAWPELPLELCHHAHPDWFKAKRVLIEQLEKYEREIISLKAKLEDRERKLAKRGAQ